ncbi:hypothetical protein [Actinoplanes sp. NPDC026619]|uniref:hypothetical protein n=1 Tax=Actinoplanes sp. NPDC026619 TaxID=3155798 RepID=UPI0033CB4F82
MTDDDREAKVEEAMRRLEQDLIKYADEPPLAEPTGKFSTPLFVDEHGHLREPPRPDDPPADPGEPGERVE